MTKVYKVGGMSEKDVHVVIHVMPMNTLLDNGNSTFMDKRSLLVSSWRRIASDALPPQNKTLGNYANSRLGENEANRLGYYGCLFLDNRGFVSEAGSTCVMMVKDGVLFTPPVTASILDSVTRDSLITLAREDLGIRVEERDITRVELYGMDEVFLCGTGGEIRPVSSIDDIPLGSEYPGTITKKIATHYAQAVTGNLEHRSNWLTPL